MSENHEKEEEFDFIREKIKKKPLDKRKILFVLVADLLLAALFGVVACFVFALVRPRMEQWLHREEATISIPRDQEEPPQEGQEAQQGDEGAPAGEGGSSDIIYMTEKKELELADYQSLQRKIYQIGREAGKSVVIVTGVSSGTDWFDNTYRNEGQASGLIIGNNGVELLILTEKRAIEGAEEMMATFSNGVAASAALKQYDGNTGIAILGVPLENIDNDTMEQIAVAVLGNSYIVAQGDPVLAIGSPQGYHNAVSVGTVLSSKNRISSWDATYTTLSTDIPGDSRGSGCLINFKGEVIGIILQGFGNQREQGTVAAVSLSELKGVIERLSNGQGIPYLGITGTTVTESIAGEFGLPRGVYVTGVQLDSPAILAGIQNGDIITKINGVNVNTTAAYESALSACAPQQAITITVMRQGPERYKEIRCQAVVGILR